MHENFLKKDSISDSFAVNILYKGPFYVAQYMYTYLIVWILVRVRNGSLGALMLSRP